MNSPEKDALNSATCVSCSKDFSNKVTELYYCLCDAAVCSKCIEKAKIDDKQWKCPKCEKTMDLESTQLFREHNWKDLLSQNLNLINESLKT